jgi:hypothetical protein
VRRRSPLVQRTLLEESPGLKVKVQHSKKGKILDLSSREGGDYGCQGDLPPPGIDILAHRVKSVAAARQRIRIPSTYRRLP